MPPAYPPANVRTCNHDGFSQTVPGQALHGYGAYPSGDGCPPLRPGCGSGQRWEEDRYEVNARKWDMKSWVKLNLDKPTTFAPWLSRAREWLVDNRPSMDRLLRSLEEWQRGPLTTEAAEHHVAQLAGLPGHWGAPAVSWTISSAIRLVAANSVVDLSQKVGEKFGFEL